MQRDGSPPRSVRDRIALLQQQYPSSASTLNPTSPTVKATATAQASNVHARPESPTSLRTRPTRPTSSSSSNPTSPSLQLEDALASQLNNRSTASSSTASSPRTTSPARTPRLPPRPGSRNNHNDAAPPSHAQVRQRSQTVDPSTTSTLARPPPVLPPRRSSTLHDDTAAITGPNSNSHRSPVAVREAPALPRRHPATDVSPRTPVVNTFEPPPLRPRPVPAPKRTLHDDDPALSQTTNTASSSPSTTRANGQSASPSHNSATSTRSKIRPIDPRARKRYERLFEQCLDSTGQDARDGDPRIEGDLVRLIWERSRLPREVLRAVW